MLRFCDRIRNARIAAGFSQESFAEHVGIKRTNYVPYETGKKQPDEETLAKIALGLGLPFEDVLAWKLIDQFGGDIILKAADEIRSERSQQP